MRRRRSKRPTKLLMSLVIVALLCVLLLSHKDYFQHKFPVLNDFIADNGSQILPVQIPQLINIPNQLTIPISSTPLETPSPTPVVAPSINLTTPIPTPTVGPAIIVPNPNSSSRSSSLPSAVDSALQRSSGKLIIPVAGVRPDQLRNTFKDARSEGRTHDAIDIMASRGTPVLASVDGTIVRLFTSERGGITIYQLGTDNYTVYYYAHLDRYADGIYEKQFVKQGQLIGYVGDTGNSGAGNYHLHFAIWTISDPKRFWNGTNLNPYDLLKPNS